MSITRAQYEAQVKTAGATAIASVIAAEGARQVTLDASNSVVGYNTINGNYANFNSAMTAANAAKLAAVFNAEVAKQQTLMIQRDLLRDSGNREPV